MLKKKIKAIKKDGLEKFFVLSDFEGILTKVFYWSKLKEFGLKSSHLRKINPFNNIFYKCFGYRANFNVFVVGNVWEWDGKKF